VAKQLDAMAQDSREANLISFLESDQIANLPADFEKISPDSLTALYEISRIYMGWKVAQYASRLQSEFLRAK